jgi:hypothetical protein
MTTIFNKRFTGPAEEALLSGQKPGEYNQLGPKESQASLSLRFASEFAKRLPLRENPGAKDLWDTNVFSNDSAQEQQKLIDSKVASNAPTFKEPLNNSLAVDFFQKYVDGVAKGLVEPERAIYSGSLARLATQPANFGSSERDPNTANKFPGASGTQI